MTTTSWYWIRHAPVPNPEARCYGQKDMVCDTSNEAAFANLATRVPHGAVWVATTLSRTQDTAKAIYAERVKRGHDAPEFALEQGLIEQSFGDYQGRTYVELGAFGHGGGANGHKHWLTPAAFVPPGGESFVALMERTTTAIERLTKAHAGRNIVCVAHGGTIRAALAHALGLDPETALAFTIDNLSLTRLDHIDTTAPGHHWRVGPVNQPAV
jgi:broad specificity phosphatase PhoE